MKILKTKEELQQIKHGDYLKGTEMYKLNKRESNGLFQGSKVKEGSEYVSVQMDDEFEGQRGNHLRIELGEITIIEPEDVEYNKEFIERNLNGVKDW